MFLRKLTLLNFKNHPQLPVEFSKKINCIIGNNGVGKTNLLDSIYYLCLTKSYFSTTDQQNIGFGADFFRLEGNFETNGAPYHIVYKLAQARKKELEVNNTPLPKLSDHIGSFPAIIITPYDSQLILGSSEERRRFLDNTISQVNRQYLLWLIEYNKVLAQRNSALKQFAENNTFDKALLEAYNARLVPLGMAIYRARHDAIERLVPAFNYYYKTISLQREQAGIQYLSQLHEKPLDVLLEESLRKDSILQRTEAGIHKDDLDFFLGTNKMKKFGSQGQQKSFVIAIKFAQYDFIRRAKDHHPILLIDDIFDKLDNDRSQQLIEMIAGEQFGQVFLTDTDDTHIRQTLAGREEIYSILRL